MIQSVLFFVLGILCASAAALLAGPFFTRRARRLEREALESALPMSMNELLSEKDRLRADFAVGVRKLEIEAKAARDRLIEQTISQEREREETRLLRNQQAAQAEAALALEKERDLLHDNLAQANAREKALEERTVEQAATIEAQKSEAFALGRLYEETSFAASSRQIELAGRDGDIERLHGELSAHLAAQRANGPFSEGDAALREEMMRLAAEVTAMVARLEGPDGTIDKILGEATSSANDTAPTLADRIRALRDQARGPSRAAI